MDLKSIQSEENKFIKLLQIPGFEPYYVGYAKVPKSLAGKLDDVLYDIRKYMELHNLGL